MVGKGAGANVLVVAQGNATGGMASSRLRASQLSWVAGAAPAGEFRCKAKTRDRQPDQAWRGEICNNGCIVEFNTSQRAVTPGQSVVLYQGDECLGGGVIDATDAPFGGMGCA